MEINFFICLLAGSKLLKNSQKNQIRELGFIQCYDNLCCAVKVIICFNFLQNQKKTKMHTNNLVGGLDYVNINHIKELKILSENEAANVSRS